MKRPGTQLLQQGAAIVLLGAALGLAGNSVSPRGLSLITPPEKPSKVDDYLALDEAKALWQAGGALFLDAREPADYAAGHIGNALNLPAQSFEQHFGEIAPMLSPDSAVVVYCDGKECELSQRLRESLRQLGYTNARVLFNGWTAWRRAGLPTEEAARR